MPSTIAYFASPLGRLTLVARNDALAGVYLPSGGPSLKITGAVDDADPLLRLAALQLREYFAGERLEFDLPLYFDGTVFQRDVWTALRTIPFGMTVSYAHVAKNIGRPRAVRAVGAANGRNPFGIIVPCHRVIGADGSMTGYGGGLPAKRWLLHHEQQIAVSYTKSSRP